MWGAPSRRSLLRLLLGAAFLLLAWVFASASSAQADEPGLLGSVAATVDSTVRPVAKATAPTSEAVTRAVTKTVSAAVDDSTEVVDDAVAAVPVVRSVQAPVSRVTATVRATTSVVVETTETTVATAAKTLSDTVIDAVDSTVDQVATTVDPILTPAPQLPGAGAPIVPGVDPGAGAPDPATLALDRAREARAAAQERSSEVAAPESATGSRVAPLFGATVRGSARGGLVPSDPEPVVPGWDLVGLAPSSAPAPGPALLLAVLIGAALVVRPEIFSAAVRSAALRPCPGPALGRGSRPD